MFCLSFLSIYALVLSSSAQTTPMEQRLANVCRLTVNERKFIQTALLSDLRIDGRGPFEYRKLNIKFGWEDGCAEVQLGETHVMSFVTAQLVQPYKDRSSEGMLSIFTEFSPMADPSFEPGRPGEFAVELGRIIDRGLRESKAVDMESLCVLPGKLVWAIRIDIHILDNGGNLVDAANIAALASLLAFRRPECSLGGENGQEVVVHPPEVREPLPLIVHHLPIAVTFGFFSDEQIVVIDPTHKEEFIMTGRMTATLNANGDICAIQKGGGQGVEHSVIMRCLQLAYVKAGDITTKIKNAVESFDKERTLRKIRRHSTSVALDVSEVDSSVTGKQNQLEEQKASHDVQKMKLSSDCNVADRGTENKSPEQEQKNLRDENFKKKFGAPSSWDPYSKGIDSDFLKASLDLPGQSVTVEQWKLRCGEVSDNVKLEEAYEDDRQTPSKMERSDVTVKKTEAKSLMDAVKPKNKRRKKASSSGAS